MSLLLESPLVVAAAASLVEASTVESAPLVALPFEPSTLVTPSVAEVLPGSDCVLDALPLDEAVLVSDVVGSAEAWVWSEEGSTGAEFDAEVLASDRESVPSDSLVEAASVVEPLEVSAFSSVAPGDSTPSQLAVKTNMHN